MSFRFTQTASCALVPVLQWKLAQLEQKPLRTFRYLVALLLCCIAVLLYGQDAGSAVEVRVNSDEFFIDQELDIDILIRHDAPFLRRSQDMPQCLLEGQSDAVQLLQSSSIPEQDGLHLRSRYRFTQTGSCTLVPVLRWKRMRLELEPLHLTVHEPPLSEQTAFLWKLYTLDGLPAAEDTAAEQGKSYLLCLTAVFYIPGYESQYREYFRQVAASAWHTGEARLAALTVSAEHTGGTRSVVPVGSSGGEAPTAVASVRHTGEAASALPLPAGILRIDCPAAENAVVELLGTAQLPPAIIGAEISSSGSPQSYILAAFKWIPLSIGMQALPQAVISFASGAKGASRPRTQQVIPWSASASEAHTESGMEQMAPVQGLGQLGSLAFTEAVPEQLLNSSAVNIQEEMSTARRIAVLRHRELSAWFPFSVRYERKKLETALGIAQPLPLYPAFGGILAAVCTVLLLIGAMWLKFRNKKSSMIPVLLLALCCAGTAVGLFKRTLQPQGVCIASSNAAVVRRIPEATGSVVYQLAVGESVWIIRNTAHWCCVKTVSGITGWVPQETLIISSTAL